MGLPSELEQVDFYVKAGIDGSRPGACPFCQRIYMILVIKAKHNLLKFKVKTVNPTKLPDEFKEHNLRHLPAIIHKNEGFDILDDVVSYITERFPGGGLSYLNSEADLVTKDMFSRFCFYIKEVNNDPSKLTASLEKINSYLDKSQIPSESAKNQFICGDHLTHLDCEIMPKLQHLRVATKSIKNYDIPSQFTGLWRYLNSAYSEEAFIQSCPCDQEIILHWHDRPETPSLSPKIHSQLAKEKPKWSMDIPVHAQFVRVV